MIEAEGIAKTYEGRQIIAPFSTRINGDRVGIIGNGAGKSTLIKMLLGSVAPIRAASAAAQPRTAGARPDADQPAPRHDGLGLSADVGGDQMWWGHPRHVVSYMRDFLPSERAARAPVDSLSGVSATA